MTQPKFHPKTSAIINWITALEDGSFTHCSGALKVIGSSGTVYHCAEGVLIEQLMSEMFQVSITEEWLPISTPADPEKCYETWKMFAIPDKKSDKKDKTLCAIGPDAREKLLPEGIDMELLEEWAIYTTMRGSIWTVNDSNKDYSKVVEILRAAIGESNE